jgi:hypothetical protein
MSGSMPPLVERTLKIGRLQDAVGEAMRFAELAVSSCDVACREAVTLAACELAENLVKYGSDHPDPRAGVLAIAVNPKVVRLRATNAVLSPGDARQVTSLVARISSPDANVSDLYRARLRELFADPQSGRAQLGLLRLAFEGGFSLSASFETPLLNVVAERPCRPH